MWEEGEAGGRAAGDDGNIFIDEVVICPMDQAVHQRGARTDEDLTTGACTPISLMPKQ